mgnify:CR=1 FL=1
MLSAGTNRSEVSESDDQSVLTGFRYQGSTYVGIALKRDSQHKRMPPSLKTLARLS